MKRNIIYLLQINFVAILLLFGSCNIYEDNSDCPMHVSFKYDYNMLYTDLLNDQCNKIELFIYDDKQTLIDVITSEKQLGKKGSFTIPITLNPGTYTMMAWGGRDQMYSINNIQPHQSHISDMQLDLQLDDEISNQPLSPLWHGIPKTFTIEQSYGHKEVIDMIKNTNRIKLSINSIDESLINGEIEVKIKAANGTYLHNNEFRTNKIVEYRPFTTQQVSDKKISYESDIMRLRSNEKVMLSMININTGQSVLPTEEVDLIELFLKTKPQNMTDQEYLDRQDIWDFALYVSQNFIAVSIQVNDWTVWVQDDEL